jgi:hypothetical protein
MSLHHLSSWILNNLTPTRRKYVDENLVADLQSQIAALESELEQDRQSHEGSHGSAGDNGRIVSNVRIESRNLGMDPSTTTLFAGRPLSNAHISSYTHYLANPPVDLCSHVAMEELASLMLTMDLEGQGEPSFTIPPGKGKSSSDDDQGSFQANSSTDTETCNHQYYTLGSEDREHLMNCFLHRFNIFHQFVEEMEGRSVRSQEAFKGKPDA